MSAGYRSQALSPVEVTKALLARIELCEPALNAMYIVDADGAVAQAAASEARWRDGKPLSAVDGVPIADVATTFSPEAAWTRFPFASSVSAPFRV